MAARMPSMSVAGATPAAANGDLVAGAGAPGPGLVELVHDRSRVGQHRRHVGRDADNLAPLRRSVAGLREAPTDRISLPNKPVAMAWLMMKTFGEVRVSRS
jgi:hypothetical protein